MLLIGQHHRDHIDKIESIGPFGLILAPQPYNKLERIVSIIHTPMVTVWFGNV
jgi:hypothetical protein